MPSKTRATRGAKTSKENVGVVKTNTFKGSRKVLKGARKPLSDKTNSTSDDNVSIHSDKPRKYVDAVPNEERPKRARRLPTRYEQNDALKNLSNSCYSISSKQESPTFKNASLKENKCIVSISPTKQKISDSKISIPVKKSISPVQKLPEVLLTPVKSNIISSSDCNLVMNRPRRVCRLPNRFDDHSISPHKYIPVQPINASTPLATKTKQSKNKKTKSSGFFEIPHNTTPIKLSKKKVLIKKSVSNGESADSNNNGKHNNKQHVSSLNLTRKILKTKSTIPKHTNNNYGVRLLDNNKNQLKRDSGKLDVYEFTFDPEEEPPPTKKKKKKTASKPKPKSITIKSNYDKNLAKALAALKNAVSSKPSSAESLKHKELPVHGTENADSYVNFSTQGQNLNLDKELSVVNEKNYNSVRVEDIARDIRDNEDDHAIDYSPVNSPISSKTQADPVHMGLPTSNNLDPLNFRDDLSFFDEPVASSSMNVSVRHPSASPWRTEFGKLPIKWQVNTYVKPNMTPAIESSFINFNDSKNKHVYTNMVPEVNDSLPEMVENTPNLIQTSILSFIKEVVERSAKKKNKGKLTPIKANSLFEDPTSSPAGTANKQIPLENNTTPEMKKQLENGNYSDILHEKEQLQILNKENQTENDVNPEASNTDENNTCFGFDDTENQENVSPLKKNNTAKSLRSRTRGILQEINECKGPTRAVVPVTVKSKNKLPRLLQQEMKSATEPPVFPEVTVDNNSKMTNVQESCLLENLDDDDCQSVHLFEDIEFKHHYKASRKSYGKAKKVAFHRKSAANSDDSSISDTDGKGVFSDEDNLDDISFKLPSEKPKRVNKKRKPKNLLSKKEEKEVEAWAAGFNSMCEDIDGFDLVVE